MAGHYKNETKCAEYNKGHDIKDYKKMTPGALKACATCGDLDYVIYQKIYLRKRQKNERIARRFAIKSIIILNL